jgi:hypothetical protein
MLHACSYTICFVFCYTSWHFYAFSRTNLLTRCHSASSCFLLFFVFQKSYTGNILGIGRNKARSSYFAVTKTESKAETEEGQEAATPGGGAGPPGRTTRWCGPLVHPLTSPFRLYILSEAKTLKSPVSVHEKFHNAPAIEDQFRGTEVSVLAPCWDGELPPEPSPSTPLPYSSPLLSPMMRRE